MKMAVYIQQELRWLAIVTQEPVLIEAFKKGLDVHSQITCQIKGFTYHLFEDIRNYKRETLKETHHHIQQLINKWSDTPECLYILKIYNMKELNSTTIPTLANAFELLRKEMKSIVFGKWIAEFKSHSKQGNLSV
ncbi:DNA polymerase I [Bacillus cereus]|uniref:DNA polymerase I n=1 Tax=Bacillus cereus TaxID=1396 RepID=UPI0018CF952E|nr:DNA polymerase I [Bacillus cereus]MBG9612508.1 DNA polymerase I [Bacillus cereus]MBG9714752.1 DNA polymerase I [Bacillus cereus]